MEKDSKPKFKFRWYDFLMIGAVLLSIVCIGGIVYVDSAPLEGGRSLGELTDLQKQIAAEYAIKVEQVEVFVNLYVAPDSGNSTTTRTLRINLINTSFDELSSSDKDLRMQAV